MASASTFGLSDQRATEVLGEVFAATEDWRQVAASNGIAERDLARMTDAFETPRRPRLTSQPGESFLLPTRPLPWR
jgi:hypothetical protein